MLQEKCIDDPTSRQQLKDALWKNLCSGKVVGSMTLEKLWERTEGKVRQDLNVSGEVDLRISERIRKARARAGMR